MTAAAKGEAQVTLSDGRVLRLVYDYDALIAVEEASGMKMPEIHALGRRGEQPGMRLQRALIFGGLQMHHPEISLKEVGDLLMTEAEAFIGIDEAIAGAHGPADEGGPAGDADEDPPSTAGTGASSSPAGAQPGSTRKASGGKRPGATARR